MESAGSVSEVLVRGLDHGGPNIYSNPAAILLLFLLHSCLTDHVFLNTQHASQVLVRTRRTNSLFEEVKPGDLERECVEEICDYEEAKEIYELKDITDNFWMKYLDCKGTERIRTQENISIVRQCIEDEAFVLTTTVPEPVRNSTCLPNYGIDYLGDLAVSLGGHTCLQWSSPEAKALSQDKEFISEANLQGNMCRNPDNDPEGPWCYVEVSGNVTVDYCDLNLCEDQLVDDVFTMEDEGFILSTRKMFFNPQTFGQGESVCGERPLFEKLNKLDAVESDLYSGRRINRDNNAEVASAPWQVTLYKLNPTEILCGASLLSDLWILTAAHCLLYPPGNKNFTPSDILVRLGKYDITRFEQGTERITTISEIIIHPKYTWMEHLNRDIALLRLKRPIKFTNEIHPICLPSKEVAKMLITQGFKGRVTGWGKLKETRNPTARYVLRVLQQIHLPIVDKYTCTGSTSVRITDNMFCAGYEPEGSQPENTCEGNDGGPIVMKNLAENRWYQLGIASLGEGCERYGTYGLYTHVFRMNKWMRKVIDRAVRDDSLKQT